MSFFYIGLVRGYSAPAVPSIIENNPEIFPDKNIASWASKRLIPEMFDISCHVNLCTFYFSKIKFTFLELSYNRFNSTSWCIYRKYCSGCFITFHWTKIYNSSSIAISNNWLAFNRNSFTLWCYHCFTISQWILCWFVFAISSSLRKQKCRLKILKSYLMV